MLPICLALLMPHVRPAASCVDEFQVQPVQAASVVSAGWDGFAGATPASIAWLRERFSADQLEMLAATSDGRKAFIPNPTEGSVTAVDLWNLKELATTPVGRNVGAGVVLPGNIDYAVCVSAENRVAFLNTASHEVVGYASVEGMKPAWIAADPVGQYLFVAGDQAALAVISSSMRSVVERVALPSIPRASAPEADGRGLLFECGSGTFRVLPTSRVDPVMPSGRSADDTLVYVMGMTHSSHRTSKQWGLDHVAETIRRIQPEVIVTEIPPDRFEAALAGWHKDRRISEPRVMRFPEYTDVLFQLMDEMDFAVEPAAAWTAEMNNLRNARIAQFREDPEHAEAFARYTARNAEIEAAQAKDPIDEDNPLVIHSDAYDKRTEEALEPYDTFLNDWIGPGGWTNINLGHAQLAEQAILRHPGKRILITFGAGHKYWMSRYLAERGFQLGDIQPFLPQSAELPMKVQVEREIKDLHAFFEDWFTGRSSNTDESYARFSMALDDDFVIVTPEGQSIPKPPLLDGLRSAHASRAESEGGFAIRVENIDARDLGQGHWLVRYEEWQDSGGEKKGRISSAVLVENDSAPGGFTWMHVHETWLQPK